MVILVDYRTQHHKGTHIIFLEDEEGCKAAVFSSFTTAFRALRHLTYNATLHDIAGNIIAYKDERGVTICQP